MNAKQARAIKIGQRVTWLTPDGIQPTTLCQIEASYGTVTEKDYARMMVEWDDGLKCSYRLDEASNIHLA
jgi:hypothetical protein